MTVTVKMLVDKLKLKVVYGNEELLAKAITTADISRPAKNGVILTIIHQNDLSWLG